MEDGASGPAERAWAPAVVGRAVGEAAWVGRALETRCGFDVLARAVGCEAGRPEAAAEEWLAEWLEEWLADCDAAAVGADVVPEPGVNPGTGWTARPEAG